MIDKMKSWYAQGKFNGTIYGNYIYVNGGRVNITKQEARQWKELI
jgi:hypothetical protein